MNREGDPEEGDGLPESETVSHLPNPGICPSSLPAGAFPGYRLVGTISTGGQSVVYKAVQESTKRKVAIKVMKDGPFADSSDRARFDREIQILGRLNHPNVVAIHETGVSSGCHYFVMDYVSGESLDAYVERTGASVKEVLDLFVKVCDAVNAAHLNGIIHRDLKPSNIRVDPNGEPHVLDFGLAKVATSEADPVMVTMTGQFLGSLPWASPEQAEAIPGKMDIRTDVYSLGVSLYQMLTGRFPYEVVGNIRDVLDTIMKAEPVRPSTTRKQVDNELDTIVLKSLAKNRDRRYQTAGELGRDLQRYLKGEPIEAKRDSLGYMLRKHLARYRLAFGIGTAFAILIIAALAFTFHLWRKAEEQREAAEASIEFLESDVFGSLRRTSGDSIPPLEQVLDWACEHLEATFADAPLAEAQVRNMAGTIYLWSLQRPDRASVHFERALDIKRKELGPDHLEVSLAMCQLADALWSQGRHDSSIQLCSDAVSIQRAAHRGDHLSTAKALMRSARSMDRKYRTHESEQMCREALGMLRRLPADHRKDKLDCLSHLSTSMSLGGARLEDSEQVHRDLVNLTELEYGPGDFRTLLAMNSLAFVLERRGDHSGAGSLYVRAIEALRKSERAADDPYLLLYIENLARTYNDQARYADAELWYREALDLMSTTADTSYPMLLGLLGEYAGMLSNLGRHGEAEALYAEWEPAYRGRLDRALQECSPGDAEVFRARRDLADLLEDMGVVHEAISLYEEAIRDMESANDDEAQELDFALMHLADLYCGEGRFAEAETLAIRGFSGLMEDRNTRGRMSRLPIMRELVGIYEAWGKPEMAIPFVERCARDALAKGGDASYLNDASWCIVRIPGLPPDLYDLAIQAAALAIELRPDDYLILNTLGVAQYRAGLYDETLATLRRSEQMVPDNPFNVTFIAMAHCHLGQEEEAMRNLEHANRLAAQPRYDDDDELEAFMAEARNLIEPSIDEFRGQ